MATSDVIAELPVMPAAETHPHPADHGDQQWRPGVVLAFRFCFVYFGLYVLTTQMLRGMVPLPVGGIPDLSALPPFRNIFLWVGRHILGIAGPIPYQLTGSGDRTYDWVQVFSLLLIAVSATLIWSAAARGRHHHPALYRWFRLFIRFGLATTMLSYGLVKAVPLQMPAPSLGRLLEPFGAFSPMGVLWASIGASRGYEIFVGCAELGAGLLLFLPRTVTLGALLCLMDTMAIFTLNMTYDVPVKLFAFHLVLMSLFLLAPNIRVLFDLLVRHRAVRLRGEPPIGATPRIQRAVPIAQAAFGIYALLLGAHGSVQAWRQYGGGSPKSALYGIWEVDNFTMDGEVRPPLATDTARWRRIVFDRPTSAALHRMNDLVFGYRASIDTTAHTVSLTASDSAHTTFPLTFQRPARDRLLLEGDLAGHAVNMELSLRDPTKFRLKSRGFHWIQERPFNR